MQKTKTTLIEVYEKTPFTIDQEDVLLFNNLEEQNNYFEKELKIIYKTLTNAYVKDSNYIYVTGHRKNFLKATYLRLHDGKKWVYGFILEVLYINYNTTCLIFEIDYFNTYQQYIDFKKVYGTVEQSHLKRKTLKKVDGEDIFTNNIVRLPQGFNMGQKIPYSRLSYNSNILWLVIVAKPTIKIKYKYGNFGTTIGSYSPFYYFIMPTDIHTMKTKKIIIGDKEVQPMNVTILLKTVANTFDEEEQINTVNQIVNIYTTREINLNYQYIEDEDTVVLEEGDFDLINLEEDLSVVGSGDNYLINNTDNNSPTICPKMPTGNAKVRFTSEFGWRTFLGSSNYHTGFDIAPEVSGTKIPIYAVQDGTVQYTGFNDGGYGNYVYIKHTSGDNHISLYGHLDSYNVSKGQKVKQGEKIGVMGTTGNSTGVHLHFEIHKNVDSIVFGQNGTASDPRPYLLECVEPKSSMANTSTFKGSLKNGDKTLSENQIRSIITICKKYNVLPSGVICQLWYESNWGNSNVARKNNNWAGITWRSGGNRLDPTVTKEGGRYQGTARPSNEGGYYTAYKSLDYFFMDYIYLLTQTGYKVAGQKTIEDYTRGLFRAGGKGSTLDYAATGLNNYLSTMISINSRLNNNNSNYKNVNREVFNVGV